jgi:glycosyltransferase involved in cell wall biosynthesis
MKPAVILSEPHRQSYRIIARHYVRSMRAARIDASELVVGFDRAERRRAARGLAGAVAFHNTIGPLFEPLPGVVNVALLEHEWSRYPAAWVDRLNRFDAVWTTTRFVRRVLRSSGVTVPVSVVPPALDLEPPAPKHSWVAARPFRFLTCGEPHFRKGFHLLIAGFLEAFPKIGAATLTIKTSSGCTWLPPRRDVIVMANTVSRSSLLGLYRGFDAYVSTSLGEGLGLPVAEAVLSQLPVATHRWGGHADLLGAGACFELPYKVIDQPFATDPSYYAPGQRCAFSHPSHIAAALRRAVESSPASRERMTRRARLNLLSTYGAGAAVLRLRRAWQELTEGRR